MADVLDYQRPDTELTLAGGLREYYALAVVPLVLWRCLQLNERWPWSEFDGDLDVPLVELRGRYGIELVLR